MQYARALVLDAVEQHTPQANLSELHTLASVSLDLLGPCDLSPGIDGSSAGGQLAAREWARMGQGWQQQGAGMGQSRSSASGPAAEGAPASAAALEGEGVEVGQSVTRGRDDPVPSVGPPLAASQEPALASEPAGRSKAGQQDPLLKDAGGAARVDRLWSGLAGRACEVMGDIRGRLLPGPGGSSSPAAAGQQLLSQHAALVRMAYASGHASFLNQVADAAAPMLLHGLNEAACGGGSTSGEGSLTKRRADTQDGDSDVGLEAMAPWDTTDTLAYLYRAYSQRAWSSSMQQSLPGHAGAGASMKGAQPGAGAAGGSSSAHASPAAEVLQALAPRMAQAVAAEMRSSDAACGVDSSKSRSPGRSSMRGRTRASEPLVCPMSMVEAVQALEAAAISASATEAVDRPAGAGAAPTAKTAREAGSSSSAADAGHKQVGQAAAALLVGKLRAGQEDLPEPLHIYKAVTAAHAMGLPPVPLLASIVSTMEAVGWPHGMLHAERSSDGGLLSNLYGQRQREKRRVPSRQLSAEQLVHLMCMLHGSGQLPPSMARRTLSALGRHALSLLRSASQPDQMTSLGLPVMMGLLSLLQPPGVATGIERLGGSGSKPQGLDPTAATYLQLAVAGVALEEAQALAAAVQPSVQALPMSQLLQLLGRLSDLRSMHLQQMETAGSTSRSSQRSGRSYGEGSEAEDVLGPFLAVTAGALLPHVPHMHLSQLSRLAAQCMACAAPHADPGAAAGSKGQPTLGSAAAAGPVQAMDVEPAMVGLLDACLDHVALRLDELFTMPVEKVRGTCACLLQQGGSAQHACHVVQRPTCMHACNTSFVVPDFLCHPQVAQVVSDLTSAGLASGSVLAAVAGAVSHRLDDTPPAALVQMALCISHSSATAGLGQAQAAGGGSRGASEGPPASPSPTIPWGGAAQKGGAVSASIIPGGGYAPGATSSTTASSDTASKASPSSTSSSGSSSGGSTAASRLGATPGPVRLFMDSLADALVRSLPALAADQLCSLVPASAGMPATQRRMLLRNLAAALAPKVRAAL